MVNLGAGVSEDTAYTFSSCFLGSHRLQLGHFSLEAVLSSLCSAVRLRLVARLALFLTTWVALTLPLHASDWTTPTPEELKMTADPAAPGAPAVFLYREETSDDKLHFHSLYVRIKVLTEKGKSWGDVEIPAYYGRAFSITNVMARTIHPDGTIIPLTGKPLEKLLLREGKERIQSTVFSLPSVEPGSILEYRYILRYDDARVLSPTWYIQQPIYMHKAHYSFTPFDISGSHYVTGAHGDVALGLTYSGRLPEGASVVDNHGVWTLDVSEVPALPDESYMPPMQSTSYRLLFYYATARTADEYWKREGKFWSKDVNRFANPSSAMHAAVASLTAPTDTPEAKLRKIYAAVQGLENTSFTRQHTAEENKEEGLRVKTADDIWAQKRGNEDELTRLFIALARAAGFKAYDMAVVNRDRDILMTQYMEWGQLNDEIAIVSVNGVDTYFDPGQRYAEYGKLHWKHSGAAGVRQTDEGTAVTTSGGTSYKDTQVLRIADLTLGEHGELTGQVRMTMSGAQALHWRQQALRVDEETLKHDFEQSIRDEFPSGVEATMDHFIGLTQPENMLMVVLKVTGTLGTSTGRRLLLPAAFFTSPAGALFPQATRQTPVDLRYPVTRQDQVTLKLPPGTKMESLPKDNDIHYAKYALYAARYNEKAGVYTFTRTFMLGEALYLPTEYADLRAFYQKMGTQDDEQAVLAVSPAAPTVGAVPAAGPSR